MDAIEIVALNKAIGKLKADAPVPAGMHHIDLTATVHVFGTIDQAEQGDYTPPLIVPWKEAIALLLRYTGVTRQESQALCARALTDAMKLGPGTIGDYLADVDAALAKAKENVGPRPTEKRAGACRAQLSLEFIEPGPVRSDQRPQRKPAKKR